MPCTLFAFIFCEIHKIKHGFETACKLAILFIHSLRSIKNNGSQSLKKFSVLDVCDFHRHNVDFSSEYFHKLIPLPFFPGVIFPRRQQLKHLSG